MNNNHYFNRVEQANKGLLWEPFKSPSYYLSYNNVLIYFHEVWY